MAGPRLLRLSTELHERGIARLVVPLLLVVGLAAGEELGSGTGRLHVLHADVDALGQDAIAANWDYRLLGVGVKCLGQLA